MLEATPVRMRLSIRYPAQGSERTNSVTYSNMALNASNAALLDFGEAVTSLMYNPSMETTFIKSELLDLYMGD